MSSPPYRVRRATVEDLGALKALWAAMRYPADEFEKRLTEFQVAEDSTGAIVGSFGFQLNDRHAWIVGESFDDFAIADTIRPLFWQRIQSLSMNHGVVRLWTNDPSPFWTRNGFQPATPEVMQKLPPAWNTATGATWFTLQLKNEDAIASLDKEVTLMMEEERRRTANRLESARTLKTIITVVAFILALLIFAAAAYLYLQRQRLELAPH